MEGWQLDSHLLVSCRVVRSTTARRNVSMPRNWSVTCVPGCACGRRPWQQIKTGSNTEVIRIVGWRTLNAFISSYRGRKVPPVAKPQSHLLAEGWTDYKVIAEPEKSRSGVVFLRKNYATFTEHRWRRRGVIDKLCVEFNTWHVLRSWNVARWRSFRKQQI